MIVGGASRESTYDARKAGIRECIYMSENDVNEI